jgi:hypothetical protein
MRCPHTGGHTRSRASCVHSHREALAHAHKALEVWESGPRPPATPPAAVPDDATADGSAEPAEPVVYAPHSPSQLALDNGLTLHVRSLWCEPAVAGKPTSTQPTHSSAKGTHGMRHQCDRHCCGDTDAEGRPMSLVGYTVGPRIGTAATVSSLASPQHSHGVL